MKRPISIIFSLIVLSACQPTLDLTNLEGTWILEKENNFCGNDTSMTWTPDTTITLTFGPKFEFTKTITGTNQFKGKYSVDGPTKISFTILKGIYTLGGIEYVDTVKCVSKEELFVVKLTKDSLIAFGKEDPGAEQPDCGAIGQWKKRKEIK